MLRGGGATNCASARPSQEPHDTEDAEEWIQRICGKHMRTIWSINISSWYSRGEKLMEEAMAHGVHALVVQESNLSLHAVRGAANQAQRLGWTLKATHAPRHGRGGVLVAVRDPASIGAVTRYRCSTGHWSPASGTSRDGVAPHWARGGQSCVANVPGCAASALEIHQRWL